MKILAIESSCDETAVAVVEDGTLVLSSIIATQIEEHRLYGGVVPEIASRRHCENIVRVTNQALSEAQTTLTDIDAVAVTYAPGLIGALLVGVNFAKGISLAAGKPLIPVHHIRSHIAANYLVHHDLKPPFLCLVISGGHTHIIEVLSYTDFKVLGKTRDDAVGEAYDKVARAMGYPYPGGIEVDKRAALGDAAMYKLPRPTVSGCELDMSFSGLKTAILNLLHNSAQKGIEVNKVDLCAAFQLAVCDILSDRLFKAAATPHTSHKKIVVAGGVCANSGIRARLETECKKRGIKLYMPPLKYCGDNAAMVGAQAFYEYQAGNIASLDLNAVASLPIG